MLNTYIENHNPHIQSSSLKHMIFLPIHLHRICHSNKILYSDVQMCKVTDNWQNISEIKEYHYTLTVLRLSQ